MKRRGFLKLLGLSPATPFLPKLPEAAASLPVVKEVIAAAPVVEQYSGYEIYTVASIADFNGSVQWVGKGRDRA